MNNLWVEEKVCANCGEGIGHMRSNAKFCSTTCGNLKRSYKWRELNREKFLSDQKKANEKRRATPRGKFLDHKNRAKQSGISFNLTFEEWWFFWEEHWSERGLGGMVMCRHNDLGGYEVGNVRIDTQANNNRESCLTGGRSRA